ncbi:MAG: sulfatase activating formylglycine-generating enzyme [Myxococcota bacterium]|jgi:formylglycine-generating enzyme required for sulfatase activity
MVALSAGLAGCADARPEPVRTVTETLVVKPTGPAPEDPACSCGFDCSGGLCRVTLCTGRLWMGSPEGEGGWLEWPEIPVDVGTFQLMHTEVTVDRYDACAAAGACPARLPGGLCGGQDPGDAVGCLDWFMARDVCAWLGGRLPTAAEWEFAATNRGHEVSAPWGPLPADCAVARLGCGARCDGFTLPGPPCGYPAGTSEQGLCDLIGNAIEWVEDWHVDSYLYHPRDGTAPVPADREFRSMRGGGIGSCAEPRAQHRVYHAPEFAYGGSGVRCAFDPNAVD